MSIVDGVRFAAGTVFDTVVVFVAVAVFVIPVNVAAAAAASAAVVAPVNGAAPDLRGRRGYLPRRDSIKMHSTPAATQLEHGTVTGDADDGDIGDWDDGDVADTTDAVHFALRAWHRRQATAVRRVGVLD